jgi:hypothetical protein
MPRISQDQTQERHAFLLDLFRAQPDITRQDAMDAYKEKFGATINLKTLNQLREDAQKDPDGAAEPEADESTHDEEEGEKASGEDAASRLKAAADASAQPAPKAKPAKGGSKQKNVFVDAPKEHLDFLQRIVGQLQEAGATNVRIDHSTDRWMVVVVDAK